MNISEELKIFAEHIRKREKECLTEGKIRRLRNIAVTLDNSSKNNNLWVELRYQP